MKIACCLFRYFPHGGMQRAFLRVAESLAQQGHTIDVYVLQWEGVVPTFLTVHCLSTSAKTNHARCADFSNQVGKILEHTFYDRVIGFNKMAHLDLYYAADTCFVARKTGFLRCLLRALPRYRVFRQLEKAVFDEQSSTKILCISPKEKILYQTHYHTPDDRFYLLPPGITPDRIRPADQTERRATRRAEYAVSSQQWVLLFVAASFKTKGLDRAIHALAFVHRILKSPCQLWIVGGDQPAPYRRLAKRLGVLDQLHFMGAQSQLVDYYVAADLLIHPARVENTGNVLLEAMLCGLPILTTAICGYAFYVEESRSGKLVSDPFQQEEMNQALLTMLDQKNLTAYQTAALQYIEGKDFFSLIEKIVAIINTQE